MKTDEFDRLVPRTTLFSLYLPVRKVQVYLCIVLASFLIMASMTSSVHAATSNDPFENVNRVTYKFNQILDRVFFKPAAKTYGRITPAFAKKGIRNFFRNLDDVRIIFNEVLQLKFHHAASDIGRLAVNSTLGLGGLIDVAEPVFNLEKQNEDFGQTLASWHVPAGPYLVLPFFGPGTLRDSTSLVVDSLVHPIPRTDHVETRNALITSDVIDFREAILSFDELIIGDEYLFVREWYLQHREYLNNDGKAQVSFVEF